MKKNIFTDEELRRAHNATWGDDWTDFQPIPDSVEDYDDLLRHLTKAKEEFDASFVK